jgi:hypothetical protein
MENETKKPDGTKVPIIIGVVLLVLVTFCCCGGVICGGGATYFQRENGKGAPPVQVEKTEP